VVVIRIKAKVLSLRMRCSGSCSRDGKRTKFMGEFFEERRHELIKNARSGTLTVYFYALRSSEA
jgi:hypothetical protein